MSRIDLKTRYLGLELRNPVVASAGPLSREVDTARELEDHGVGAIVMYSLFAEQVEHESHELFHHLENETESHGEALSYLPLTSFEHGGADAYLEHLGKLKSALSVPVIGSLNGTTTGNWIDHARSIEEAGADALELNIYLIPTDREEDGRAVEDRYVELLREVKSRIRIPVALKLGPYFSSLPSMASRLCDEGADGLVLFNRFYQPDIDLENLEVFPNIVLSSPHELRLPLRFIAILRDQIEASLALTSGVDSALDVIKGVMVGADVTMVCSTLLRHGPARVRTILDGVEAWMLEHEYESTDLMRGSMSHRSSADPAAFERANYMRSLNTYRI